MNSGVPTVRLNIILDEALRKAGRFKGNREEVTIRKLPRETCPLPPKGGICAVNMLSPLYGDSGAYLSDL